MSANAVSGPEVQATAVPQQDPLLHTTSAMDSMTLEGQPADTVANDSGISALQLPRSAKDGVIKKPFGAPLEGCKPVAHMPLNMEKSSKYDAVCTSFPHGQTNGVLHPSHCRIE